jgi:hypothetical protein
MTGLALSSPRLEIVHDMVCRHRVEVEIQPPRAQLYFADERYIDPIDTQARFEAVVYNADGGVRWQVRAPDGGPGAGTIDATGRYRAPNKGTLASGATDIVTATANDDPLRVAFAWVTLVGLGPLPAVTPQIDISPARVTLYYQSGEDNAYISDCNKLRLFQATLFDSADTAVLWLVNGVAQPGTDPWFLYRAPNTGATAEVTVTARIASLPTVTTDARIVLLNYFWPAL